MLKKLVLLFLMILVFGCGQPEPRKPVQVKSGQFFKQSIERSKELLAKEQQIIQQRIEKDSTATYLTSDSGFWYTFEKQSDTATYQLKSNDEVLLSYTVMQLNGDTIYSNEEIGIVPHLIDKSQLFPGLRNAVKLLKEGEKATFIFPSSLAYGYKGDNDKIGPATPIKSSLELLKIITKNDSLN